MVLIFGSKSTVCIIAPRNEIGRKHAPRVRDSVPSTLENLGRKQLMACLKEHNAWGKPKIKAFAPAAAAPWAFCPLDALEHRLPGIFDVKGEEVHRRHIKLR